MVDEGLDAVVMEVSSQALMLHRVSGFTFDIGVAIVPLSSLSLNYDSSLEYAYLEDKDLYTGIAFITRKNEETPILINQFIECFK